MQVRDISFSSPQDNVHFDEVLFQMAEKHQAGPYLRFWESPQVFVVLGRTGKEHDEVVSSVQAEGIAVLHRCSGGGTVVQGPGCLNYTLVLSKQKHPLLNDLHRSYEWISAKIIDTLGKQGVQAYFRPLSDLAAGPHEKKFSGNAQRRGKNYILHHGTILYAFDLSLISHYLQMPKDIPVYRKQRSHKDFVTNINIDPMAFKQGLARAFDFPWPPQPIGQQERLLLENF